MLHAVVVLFDGGMLEIDTEFEQQLMNHLIMTSSALIVVDGIVIGILEVGFYGQMQKAPFGFSMG